MPFSFWGTGTRFYGEGEYGADGSFVTTEWVSFFYIPILPLHSVRIGSAERETNVIVYSSVRYEILAKYRPRLRQVLFTYGVAAAFLITFFALLPLADSTRLPWPMLAFAWLVVPPVVHAIMRRRAGVVPPEEPSPPIVGRLDSPREDWREWLRRDGR